MYKKILSGVKSLKAKYIAQVITLIENGDISIIDFLQPMPESAYRIGITGPPGAGKSSITNQLIKHYRKKNKKVGVLLVDPTSPFTDGAILGDRIRMNQYYDDDSVFIRSLATRGSKGGLSKNINHISDVLEYAGFDIVIFETVGVGQVELDVVESVDSVIVTLVPESGDDIQIMKAGLIEIADIYVINKYDRKDSDKLYLFLNNMLSMINKNDWKPSIVKTIAIKDFGILDLINEISNHKQYLVSSNLLNDKRNKRYVENIKNRLFEIYEKKFWNRSRIKLVEAELSKKSNNRKIPSEIIKVLKSETLK